MKKQITISVGTIIAVAIAVLIGYFWGRSSVELPQPSVKEVVRWEKEPYPIHDTIYRPKPYRVEVPVDRPVPVPTDTAKLFEVWKDYYLKRHYTLDYSSDTVGTFRVDVSVQENKLVSATSTVQPNRRVIERTETVYKVPKLTPWAMIGTSPDLTTNKIQFGLNLNNKYMFGATGIRMDNKYGYTLDFGINF
jgi:hypothetical protein